MAHRNIPVPMIIKPSHQAPMKLGSVVGMVLPKRQHMQKRGYILDAGYIGLHRGYLKLICYYLFYIEFYITACVINLSQTALWPGVMEDRGCDFYQRLS